MYFVLREDSSTALTNLPFLVCIFISTALLDPPACSSWADDIVAALTDYLANVKNMANYGSAMTSAAMNLAPVSHITVCVLVLV